jgi:hypothetical protein
MASINDQDGHNEMVRLQRTLIIRQLTTIEYQLDALLKTQNAIFNIVSRATGSKTDPSIWQPPKNSNGFFAKDFAPLTKFLAATAILVYLLKGGDAEKLVELLLKTL